MVTYIIKSLRVTYSALFIGGCLLSSVRAQPAPGKLKQASGGLKGYISMRINPPPEGFGYGISFYSGVWPLLQEPIADFQIGLPSTWIVPDNRGYNEPLCPVGTIARDNWAERGPSYRDVFQTIEGGLGFWQSTQFGDVVPKFRINATPNCYNNEVSSPGWGFGQTTSLKPGEMGLAQLSNCILVPPDGLTLMDGEPGQLLGNAWMALPLLSPKAATPAGDAPTGNQCWTLFINSANFTGPVAFYVPELWSRIARGYPAAEKRGLDFLPGIAGGGAMEVNTVPYFENTDAKGRLYSKIPRLQFPVNKEGNTILMQDVTMYSADALFHPVESWMSGGNPVSGEFRHDGSYPAKCTTSPIVLKQGEKNLPLTGILPVVETKMLGSSSYGLDWKTPDKIGSFPEYFRKQGDSMVAIGPSEVPDETQLKQQSFARANRAKAYTSPVKQGTVWSAPGPASGSYTTKLRDHSMVTYRWYRFIDQPTLQSLRLNREEKEQLQKLVEFIHVNWTSNKQYMEQPTQGSLVSMDNAIMVKPPKGLEIGYVPIVISQSLTR